MADKPEEKKKGGGKMVLILMPVMMVVTGAGVYVALGSQQSKAEEAPKIGPTERLETFIVNLDEPGGTRYLKVAVSLETSRPLTELERPLTIKVRDAMIVYLSGLRISQVQKAEAKEEIRGKLVELANGVYGQGVTKAAYFQEFVIQ